MGGSTSASSTSTGTGGAGGEGSWTPANLSGLALWLRSDAGKIEDPQHPGTILKWNDQSPHASQAVATNLQDGWRFDIDPSALNGQDAIRCPGNGIYMAVPDAAPLQWGTGPFLIAMVVRNDANQTSESRYWSKDIGGTGVAFTQNVPGSLRLMAATESVIVAVPFAAAFHIAIMRGPDLKLQVDESTATGPTVTANLDNTGAPVLLCMGGTNTQTMEIAEVVAVKGAVTDMDVEKLETYLSMKFGL